jgi:hypothetical protein
MTVAELLEILNDKPDGVAWDEWWAMPIMLDRGDCLQQAEAESSGLIQMNVINESGEVDEQAEPLLGYFLSIDKKHSITGSMILRVTKDQLN